MDLQHCFDTWNPEARQDCAEPLMSEKVLQLPSFPLLMTSESLRRAPTTQETARRLVTLLEVSHVKDGWSRSFEGVATDCGDLEVGSRESSLTISPIRQTASVEGTLHMLQNLNRRLDISAFYVFVHLLILTTHLHWPGLPPPSMVGTSNRHRYARAVIVHDPAS